MDNAEKNEVKSTLWDILETAPHPLFPGAGLSSIVRIQKKITDRDLILILFFFKDELWLIENGVFDLAVTGMIITLEDRLRKQLFMVPLEERPSDKELEEMGLDVLRKNLEPKLSNCSNQTLKKINRIRRAFIHTNMKIGEEIVRKAGTPGYLFWKEEHSIQKHENVRMDLKYHASDLCIELLFDWLCRNA